MTRIRLYADKSVRYAVTDLLQEKGCMEIDDISGGISKDIEEYFQKENNELDLQIANVEFAIHFLSTYLKKKPKKRKIQKSEYQKLVNAYYFKDVVEKCLNIEEELVKHRNHITQLEVEEINLRPWAKLSIALKEELETEYTKGFIGSVSKKDFEGFEKKVKELSKLIDIKVVNEDQVSHYLFIVAAKDIADDLAPILQEFKFTSADFLKRRGNPEEELDRIVRNRVRTQEKLVNLEKEAVALTKEIPNLSVIFDYFSNLRSWKDVRKKFRHSDDVFMIEGWMPTERKEEVQDALDRITKANILQEVKTEDIPPVEIKNNAFFAPFEAVTRIYGLPLSHEVDPTMFLATFFIIFFGLCLTDAGYGLLLFALTGGALLFMEVPEGMKKLVKLLMFGGIVTFILGIVFGGYFGVDPAILPEWMTYTKTINGNEVKFFIGQLINPVQEPLIVLGLAFFLGYIQVIVGKIIDGFWKIRKGQTMDGILDGLLWAYALISLGVFAAVKALPSLAAYATIGQMIFISAIVLLVLTQGRKKDNLFGKITGGILSLYGFIGYVSDILSYSRLLALGLATGIIAMSINLIAQIIGDMIPFVGPIVMVVILIGGHIFNLALNALGSFIHSGRLQYVEFFGKFMEGGGKQFQPFQEEYKYTQLAKDE